MHRISDTDYPNDSKPVIEKAKTVINTVRERKKFRNPHLYDHQKSLCRLQMFLMPILSMRSINIDIRFRLRFLPLTRSASRASRSSTASEHAAREARTARHSAKHAARNTASLAHFLSQLLQDFRHLRIALKQERQHQRSCSLSYLAVPSMKTAGPDDQKSPAG